MADFITYIENISAWVILDLVVIVAFTFPLLIFFIRKNSLRLAILFGLYLLFLSTVNIVSALTASNVLFITKKILDYFNIMLIFAFVIVYQADFKLAFAKIGRPADWLEQIKLYSSDDDLRDATLEIVIAAQNMSKNDIGAIIIIAPSTIPSNIVDTGTRLDALVSSALLESNHKSDYGMLSHG